MIDVENLNGTLLAGLIDHTFLQAAGDAKALEALCAEARRYGFAAVAVNPAQVRLCARLLQGSTVNVCAVAGFPLGQNTPALKIAEAREAIANGAQEVDVVLNQRALKFGDLEVVREELSGFAAACREHGVISKVILECCNLSDEEKVRACGIAIETGCDFVKTSTGFASGGATVADIALMRAAVGPTRGVKASGGIRTLETALEMLRAGANRLGTSNGVTIVEQFLSNATGTSSTQASAPGKGTY